MLIINRINRKLLMFIFIVLNGCGLLGFGLSKDVGFLYFDRLMLGSFQVTKF